MAKKKTLAKLVDELTVLTQKLVRLKASNGEGYFNCITCNALTHWKKGDGGALYWALLLIN